MDEKRKAVFSRAIEIVEAEKYFELKNIIHNRLVNQMNEEPEKDYLLEEYHNLDLESKRLILEHSSKLMEVVDEKLKKQFIDEYSYVVKVNEAISKVINTFREKYI